MLMVSEIFLSIQGETTHSGRSCAFVRLAGCNLDCAWCDTRYARTEPGDALSVEECVERVSAYGVPLVSVTGGEPLVQEETPSLVAALAERGRTVLVETNGSLDITPLAPPARRMLDVKPPSSGCADAFEEETVSRLRPGDEVKLPVADRTDYESALAWLAAHRLPEAVPVHMTPVAPRLAPATLAEWMLADRPAARLTLQLHRILWPDRVRGA